MARSTPILILSLLLLAAISNACNTCILPSPAPPPPAACPRDTLKFRVCMDFHGGVVGGVVKTPASSPCCALLKGMVDLDVAFCLCTAMKANVLGTQVNFSIALSAIVSSCGKSIPPGFKCE